MSKLREHLNEATYVGNLGFEEMVSFYKKADKTQQKRMENALESDDWGGFKDLIKKVLGITLK